MESAEVPTEDLDSSYLSLDLVPRNLPTFVGGINDSDMQGYKSIDRHFEPTLVVGLKKMNSVSSPSIAPFKESSDAYTRYTQIRNRQHNSSFCEDDYVPFLAEENALDMSDSVESLTGSSGSMKSRTKYNRVDMTGWTHATQNYPTDGVRPRWNHRAVSNMEQNSYDTVEQVTSSSNIDLYGPIENEGSRNLDDVNNDVDNNYTEVNTIDKRSGIADNQRKAMAGLATLDTLLKKNNCTSPTTSELPQENSSVFLSNEISHAFFYMDAEGLGVTVHSRPGSSKLGLEERQVAFDEQSIDDLEQLNDGEMLMNSIQEPDATTNTGDIVRRIEFQDSTFKDGLDNSTCSNQSSNGKGNISRLYASRQNFQNVTNETLNNSQQHSLYDSIDHGLLAEIPVFEQIHEENVENHPESMMQDELNDTIISSVFQKIPPPVQPTYDEDEFVAMAAITDMATDVFQERPAETVKVRKTKNSTQVLETEAEMDKINAMLHDMTYLSVVSASFHVQQQPHANPATAKVTNERSPLRSCISPSRTRESRQNSNQRQICKVVSLNQHVEFEPPTTATGVNRAQTSKQSKNTSHPQPKVSSYAHYKSNNNNITSSHKNIHSSSNSRKSLPSAHTRANTAPTHDKRPVPVTSNANSLQIQGNEVRRRDFSHILSPSFHSRIPIPNTRSPALIGTPGLASEARKYTRLIRKDV